MNNLEESFTQLQKSYNQIYRFYEDNYRSPKISNLHELMLLKHNFFTDWEEVRLKNTTKTGFRDPNIALYIKDLIRFLSQVSLMVSTISRKLYYSESEFYEIIDIFNRVGDEIYDLCKNNLILKMPQHTTRLIHAFSQLNEELKHPMFRGTSEFMRNKIYTFIGSFNFMFSDLGDQIEITPDGFYTDPVYVEFWQRLIDEAEISDDLISQYSNGILSRQLVEELFRHVPESVINMYVNLSKMVNLMPSRDMPTAENLANFENTEFADYLREKIYE